jgi:hypothetical protein
MGHDAYRIGGCDETLVENNRINFGTSDVYISANGIRVYNSDNTTIRGNKFWGKIFDVHVFLQAAYSGSIENTVIEDNEIIFIRGNNPGIYLWVSNTGSGTQYIKNTSIRNNVVADSDGSHLIKLTEEASSGAIIDTFITNNVISKTISTKDGIRASGNVINLVAKNNIITDVNVALNGLIDSSYNLIYNNYSVAYSDEVNNKKGDIIGRMKSIIKRAT